MNSLTHWKGTFELYQDRKFAEIVAKHYRLKVLDLDGLLVLARKNPLLGYTNAVIGSPEVKGPIQDCLKKIAPLKFSQLDIHTTQEIPSLSQYLVSPKNNMNMLIDLTDGEEKIFSRFSKDRQKGILRGLKKGVTMIESSDRSAVAQFYRLLVKMSDSGKRYDIPPLRMIEEAIDAGYAKVMLCFHGGNVIGGNTLICGKHNVSGWSSCYDPVFNSFQVGNVMVYETIKWAVSRGHQIFDFGQQSLSAEKTLVDFKMGFNPILTPSYSYRIVKGGFAPLLRGVFDMAGAGR